MYIDQTDRIEVITNIVSLLNCKCKVIIPKYASVMVFADSNCDIDIEASENSIVKVEYWGNATVSSNEKGKVKIRKR
jgi:hypothetical protein